MNIALNVLYPFTGTIMVRYFINPRHMRRMGNYSSQSMCLSVSLSVSTLATTSFVHGPKGTIGLLYDDFLASSPGPSELFNVAH